MAESGIITGQYVRIQPTVASVGDRIFAQLIDWGVLLAYIALLTWFVVETNISGWVVATLYLFPLLFYTLICEVLNQGQTLGKMVLNIRVVKMDGSMPTLGAYLMRWMLWLIDGPATSFVGLVAMILNRNNQRLGDMAAGTVVIKKQKYKKIQISLDEYDYLAKNYTPRYPQASDLSLEQIEIITRAISTQRDGFDLRLNQLAKKVQQKFNIERKEANDLAFLQRVVRDYQYYALEEI
ncbi:RDD family protein [uncultured Prevotella sp.]|jgi:uncharacterized RDD family membrane protein YckC|uniref:RDD family protein n=1 Tax=uncultured Prevotella sp. TaxID=159272 RepID=UPI0025DDD40C|nr:RDD family protein [uncultured Prevotella sp.]